MVEGWDAVWVVAWVAMSMTISRIKARVRKKSKSKRKNIVLVAIKGEGNRRWLRHLMRYSSPVRP